MKTEEIFAIRCYRNGKRKMSSQLTKREARNFRIAARHLSRFLTKAYKLGR